MNYRNQQNQLPYTTAHFWLLGLLAITFLAFWDSYFGVLSKVSLADHWHGTTATTWILLMAFQSYTIHKGNRSLHRTVGLLLFVSVPLMVGAFAMVIQAAIQKTVAGHPFYQLFGEALLTVDFALLVVVPLQVFLALKYRHRVLLHSALMLSTVAGLLPPVLSRLFSNYVPGLMITGPETVYLFEYSLVLGMACSAILGVLLYRLHQKDGWPWLLAAALSVFYYVMYATLGQTEIWHQVVLSSVNVKPLAAFICGVILGLLSCVLGWHWGHRKRVINQASLA